MTETHERTERPAPPGTTTRRRKAVVLLLACTAMGMANLDTAIVNIALPSIQSEFTVGRDTVQWVVVAYSLILGGFLLVGGRTTDRLGRRRTFVTGITLMASASLVAGMSGSAGVLIAARGGQGLGAALVIPAALSLLAATFEEGPERDRAIGAFGAVGGIAGSFGVVVGGLLTAGPGWRWAFFINVPTGTALVVLAAVVLSQDRDRDLDTPLDLGGATAVTGGLLLAVYGLHHATGHGWLTGSTAALMGGAAALLVVFALLEARADVPLIPRPTWRNRTVVTANLAAFLAFAALFGFIFLGTLLMQQVMGYSPIRTGIAWLATTATVFVAAMAGGRLAGRVGLRRMLVTGLVLVAVGALLLTRVAADTDYATGLVPAFVLIGVGFGLCGPAVQMAALTGVPAEQTGVAAGLIETTREIGGAAGVAFVTTALVTSAGLAGFHAGFTLVAGLAVAGGLVASVGIRAPRPAARELLAAA